MNPAITTVLIFGLVVLPVALGGAWHVVEARRSRPSPKPLGKAASPYRVAAEVPRVLPRRYHPDWPPPPQKVSE